MRIIPLQTKLLKVGDSFCDALLSAHRFEEGDIVVISSKAVATVEGTIIDLSTLKPTEEAILFAKNTESRDAAFIQAVLEETKRLHGSVVGACPGALLTEVRPAGLTRGSILTANAGLDESNIAKGFAVGWPTDPVASITALKKEIEEKSGCFVAVLLSDSCCRPRRWGVEAFALAVAGLDPLSPQAGRADLYGKKLRITTEATADQLATAANFVMGNAGQSIPAAVIRDHGLSLSEFCGWVPGIEPEEDLFKGIS